MQIHEVTTGKSQKVEESFLGIGAPSQEQLQDRQDKDRNKLINAYANNLYYKWDTYRKQVASTIQNSSIQQQFLNHSGKYYQRELVGWISRNLFNGIPLNSLSNFNNISGIVGNLIDDVANNPPQNAELSSNSPQNAGTLLDTPPPPNSEADIKAKWDRFNQQKAAYDDRWDNIPPDTPVQGRVYTPTGTKAYRKNEGNHLSPPSLPPELSNANVPADNTVPKKPSTWISNKGKKNITEALDKETELSLFRDLVSAATLSRFTPQLKNGEAPPKGYDQDVFELPYAAAKPMTKKGWFSKKETTVAQGLAKAGSLAKMGNYLRYNYNIRQLGLSSTGNAAVDSMLRAMGFKV